MAYATPAQLAERFPALSQQNAQARSDELDAASSWIDFYCGRSFTLETNATVRYFDARRDRYVIDLDRFEIGTTDGVVIATDDGTGTYATAVSAGSYQLEPVNAPSERPHARPYTHVRALDSIWPVSVSPATRPDRIKITARYGWPAVPQPIRSATMLLVMNSFENAAGVKSEAIDGYSVTYMSAGGQELGVPSSVLTMLAPFRRGWTV